MRRLRTNPSTRCGGLHGGGQRRVPVGGLARERARGLLREVRSRHQLLQLLRRQFTPVTFDEDALAFSAHAEIGPGRLFPGRGGTGERAALLATRSRIDENFERWRRNGSHDARDRAGVLWREAIERYDSRRWTRPCMPS